MSTPSHNSPYPPTGQNTAPPQQQPQQQQQQQQQQQFPNPNLTNLPPLQPPRHYSTSPYQATSPYLQSPTSRSPTIPGPAMNQQQMSPNPVSPYSHSPYTSNSPYATSPQGQYLNIPPTPATTQAPQPFHQPQPFQHHHVINQQQSRQSSMPPPKVPYSKTQETAELEKDPRGADINQISDVLSGAGVDLRAEEENLLSNYRQSGASFGNATNSQGSTISPNNSFGQWPHGTTLHGAFQGTGPLSQPVSEKDIEAELNRKHEAAARALAEAQQHHLNDPFLQAQAVRNKLASKAYEHGIGINVEGLFDKIAQTPQNTTRSVLSGPNDEAVGLARADSILNRDAPMVDVITLISLATQERLRGILEDTVAMSRIRQTTADGVVPPAWADIAVGKGPTKPTTVVPTNITKTAWEGPDSAISPMTVPGQKGPRLPTPPTEVPPTPQSTVFIQSSATINALKRKAASDLKFEEERIARRQKRQQANNAASADSPAAAIPAMPIPERMTKKERDRMNKLGQSEDVLHQKANETARLALGSSKKYSWMTGGSGASTPSRLNTNVGGLGSSTPANAAPAVDSALRAKEKQLGVLKESGPGGKMVQIRDLLLVLEADGKDKKTAGAGFARLKAVEKAK